MDFLFQMCGLISVVTLGALLLWGLATFLLRPKNIFLNLPLNKRTRLSCLASYNKK